MALWLVERTDDVDYDEHDAAVVRAATAEDAVRLVLAEWGPPAPGRSGTWRDLNPRVTAIDPEGEPGIVLGSFNAG